MTVQLVVMRTSGCAVSNNKKEKSVAYQVKVLKTEKTAAMQSYVHTKTHRWSEIAKTSGLVLIFYSVPLPMGGFRRIIGILEGSRNSLPSLPTRMLPRPHLSGERQSLRRGARLL